MPGGRWDIDLGKKKFFYVLYFMIFWYFSKCMCTDEWSKCLLADVGRRRPPNVPKKHQRGEPRALVLAENVDAGRDLADVEESLDRLLIDIQDVDLDDLPRGLQHHVVGVPARFLQFLRKLASLVAMYREHRP